MPRLVVVLPLQPLAVGDGFSLSDWPLHVTVAPTFVIAAPQQTAPGFRTVADVIAPILRAQPVLRVRVGQDEGFGRSGKIPVSVVEPDPGLSDLHTRLVAVLTAIGAIFDDPEFIGAGYRAHVTKTKVAQAHPGNLLVLTQAVIVDMEPEGDRRLRRVVWAVPLAGGAS